MDSQAHQTPAPVAPNQPDGVSQDVHAAQSESRSSSGLSPSSVDENTQPLALQANTAEHNAVQTPVPPPPGNGVLSDVDKEWVEKARDIILQTKGDPYVQSKEIGKLREEYLRVRFDKHFSIVKDQAQ